MDKQKTIEKEFSISGIGLHTANKVNMVFKPAPEGTGINFTRVDLQGKPVIKASVENAIQQPRSLRRSSIKKDNVVMHTIEHLMAALSGLAVDNLNIEIDSDEVPGLDGSSLNFAEAIIKASIKEQEKERGCFVIREPMFVEEQGSSIMAVPYDGFKISYTLDYNHSYLKTQFKVVNIEN